MITLTFSSIAYGTIIALDMKCFFFLLCFRGREKQYLLLQERKRMIRTQQVMVENSLTKYIQYVHWMGLLHSLEIWFCWFSVGTASTLVTSQNTLKMETKRKNVFSWGAIFYCWRELKKGTDYWKNNFILKRKRVRRGTRREKKKQYIISELM